MKEDEFKDNTEEILNQLKPKRTYTGHGIRRMQKQLRMDFPGARSKKEAYQTWKAIMALLRNTDNTTIISTKDKSKQLTHRENLLTEKQAHKYTDIEALEKIRCTDNICMHHLNINIETNSRTQKNPSTVCPNTKRT